MTCSITKINVEAACVYAPLNQEMATPDYAMAA